MLKLILPKGYEFNVYDYGTPISFTVYNEDETAFDGSTYNGYLEITNEDGITILEIQTTQIDSAGAGTFSFTQSSRPVSSTDQGFTQYYIAARLEKTGEVLGTERRKVILLTAPATTRLP